MKNKTHQYVLVFFLLTSIVSTNVFAAQGNLSTSVNLISGQTASVEYLDTQEKMGFFDVRISDISVDAGIYPGWCIQKDIVGDLHNQTATLYASISPNLPPDLAGLPWNKINYVLNHKIRGHNRSDVEFINDVQGAIWLLLGEQNIGFFASKQAQQMVEEANAHPDYIPGDGDILAIIVYSDGMDNTDPNSFQEAIIEYKMDRLKTSTPTPTATGVVTDTPTPTVTGTITDTFTPTNTSTPTVTGTITDTFTPTITSTPTVTGTVTDTFTPTNTSTPTVTGTVTDTFTPTNTSTPTVTGTITETFTPTPTPTSTFTFTPTVTPPTTCEPVIVIADFSQVNAGDSVEGLGKIAPGLNIDAKGTAIKISESIEPDAYGAPNTGTSLINGGLDFNGGFSDLSAGQNKEAHQYTFTFEQGVSVSKFSLHMLDFGDYNPSQSKSHYVSMTAYNAANSVISKQELVYTTPTGRTSPQYGDLSITGDAKTAKLGEPGNWMWNVKGVGITKVVLDFGEGFDPKVGFDLLAYITECQACAQPIVKTDFSDIQVGDSVEGLNVAAPNLNIDAIGTAIKIFETILPAVYGAPNENTIPHGGLSSDGGFGDFVTRSTGQAQYYTFTFSPGIVVEQFSLHMLDFGDYNPTKNPQHYASLTGYTANNVMVSRHELSYTTTSGLISPEYGNLKLTGDAITAANTASLGLPGDWTWNVNGKNMAKIVLEFGDGYDPNIGFDTLSYCPQSP